MYDFTAVDFNQSFVIGTSGNSISAVFICTKSFHYLSGALCSCFCLPQPYIEEHSVLVPAILHALIDVSHLGQVLLRLDKWRPNGEAKQSSLLDLTRLIGVNLLFAAVPSCNRSIKIESPSALTQHTPGITSKITYCFYLCDLLFHYYNNPTSFL